MISGVHLHLLVNHAPVFGALFVLATGADSEMGRKRTAVQQLIAAYRNVGQRWADLDPLKRTERPNIPDLDPAFYGFSDADQETVFDTSNTFFGKDRMSLRELVNALRETYCGTLGAEYMYTTDMTEKRWWQQKLESIRSKANFNYATPGIGTMQHFYGALIKTQAKVDLLHVPYRGSAPLVADVAGGQVQSAGGKGRSVSFANTSLRDMILHYRSLYAACPDASASDLPLYEDPNATVERGLINVRPRR